VRLNQLSEADISHNYAPNQADWPGIEMSKLLAGMVAKLLPTDDTHIQILPSKEPWASTIKITHRGRISRSVDIQIVVKPEEAYAKIVIPGTIGIPRPGQRVIKAQELNRYDLMDPRSFEKSAAEAAKYLTA